MTDNKYRLLIVRPMEIKIKSAEINWHGFISSDICRIDSCLFCAFIQSYGVNGTSSFSGLYSIPNQSLYVMIPDMDTVEEAQRQRQKMMNYWKRRNSRIIIWRHEGGNGEQKR